MRPASNITKFYIWKFLEGCKFIYAIRVIYLIGKGITAPQLALSASIAMVCAIALEIHTGYIADRFSRKLSVSLGFAAQGLSYLTLIYAHDLFTLVPAAVLLGTGSALLSGSAASLLFDELKKDSQQAAYLRISSRGTSLSTLSGAMATFGVSFDLAYAARLHVIPSISNPFLSSENRALSLSSMSFVSKLGAAILLPIATLVFTSNPRYTIVPVVLVALLLMLYPSRKGAGYPAR